MIVFLNGKFVDEKKALVSAFDHGFLYGDGVYETLRTYNGKIWQLDEHLKRLQQSAKWLKLALPWSLQQLAEWTVETVRCNGLKESRIRISLTRGVNDYNFVTCLRPTLCIQVKPLIPQPAWVYTKGVAVITVRMDRLLPQAKTISLLSFILAQQQVAKKRAYEALFVAYNGYVREGTITNVFIIRKGVLITPKTGILAGTTRSFLLKIARKMGLKTKVVDFKLNQLYSADEIFITNAPRGIIPVVKVDGKLIGSGKPGKLTRAVMEAFKINHAL